MTTMQAKAPTMLPLDECETDLTPAMFALEVGALPRDPKVPVIDYSCPDTEEMTTRPVRSETPRNTAETMITDAPCWGGR